MIGYCKYCGQGMEVVTDKAAAANDYASNHCTCAGSRTAQKLDKLREAAREMSAAQGWTDKQEAAIILIGELVLRDELEGATLGIDGERVSVKILSNGNLRITVKATREKNVEVG